VSQPRPTFGMGPGGAGPQITLRPNPDDIPFGFSRMVGQSPAMRQLFELLRRAAASDATVLIEGETGTGKELSAAAIHEQSARSRGPFMVVDCGAMPPQLLESELFGYERGAFTGAVTPRAGAFEAANGGTIFLDELGELSLDMQPKILRVLEGRKVKRLGSNLFTPINVRVVAATNRNLREEVAMRRFRSDLYYRLAVLHITLPPLRERKADLPALVDDVLRQLGVHDDPQTAALRTPAFTELLASYRWPGNVRQLRNYVERRVALGDDVPAPGADSWIPPALPGAPGPVAATHLPLRDAREEWNTAFEHQYLTALLAEHDNNIAAAARAAGINRVHLYRLIRKHNLRDVPVSEPEEG